MLSVPAEDSKGQTMNLTVQCGNNSNFDYNQLSSSSTVETTATDKQLVVYIRQLLSHERQYTLLQTKNALHLWKALLL